MTPEQREARRERQRLHNVEPKHKVALKLSKKKFKDVQKHTLHLESITMENPLYIPEVVWPTAGASGNYGTTIKSSDWDIPEFSATPLYIPPPYEEADEEGCDELLSGHMTQRSHVPFGQRHALLTHVTQCLSIALVRTQGHLIKMVTAWLKTEWVLIYP